MFFVVEENKAEAAISISTRRGSFVMIDMFTTELIVILVRLVLDRLGHKYGKIQRMQSALD